jgi:hypothetical protein
MVTDYNYEGNKDLIPCTPVDSEVTSGTPNQLRHAHTLQASELTYLSSGCV